MDMGIWFSDWASGAMLRGCCLDAAGGQFFTIKRTIEFESHGILSKVALYGSELKFAPQLSQQRQKEGKKVTWWACSFMLRTALTLDQRYCSHSEYGFLIRRTFTSQRHTACDASLDRIRWNHESESLAFGRQGYVSADSLRKRWVHWSPSTARLCIGRGSAKTAL